MLATNDEVQPVENEALDRFLTGTVTVLPFVGLAVAGWQTWNDLLHWHDLVVFAVVYLATGIGVTVGFHRLLTHRAFETGPRTAPTTPLPRPTWGLCGSPSSSVCAWCLRWSATQLMTGPCTAIDPSTAKVYSTGFETWKERCVSSRWKPTVTP